MLDRKGLTCSEKWLSALWILPTCDEIDVHHAEVARFMAKTCGLIRVCQTDQWSVQ